MQSQIKKDASLSKITPPKISNIVRRKRLFKILNKERNSPILWVSAPAGSGKTTLITDYLAVSKIRCLWYQIDEGDADISTFFYYMGLAAKKANPYKRKPLPLLTPEYLQGIPAFTRRYFEGLYSRLTTRHSRPFIIVFDKTALKVKGEKRKEHEYTNSTKEIITNNQQLTTNNSCRL